MRTSKFLILILILGSLGIQAEAQKKSKNFVYPLRPSTPINLQESQLYYELVKDSVNIDWSRLDGTLEYIRNEYDCSDFRLVNLIRILYEYGDRIPAEYMSKIEEVLFNFRYWWDEPGENSMCYWSENHQALFASAEYLVGKLYPDTVFPSSGFTGRERMERARARAMEWLEMRWKYGFIEYYSNVYYKEDIGALINLIDYAGDEELVQKCRIIMDLLFYDIASQTTGTLFVSVSGRAYQNNRTGIEDGDFGGLTNYYWGNGEEIGPGMMYGMMVSKNYQLPPVLRSIAMDTSTLVIRQSNGLDLTELKDEGYYGSDNRSMMMQWGMEAFTNPVIIRNSLAHIRNCNMFTNAFVSDFRVMDFFLLKWFHLEPTVSRILNPQYNGVAIQKGDTYTYKTADYSMYTVQRHQPGDYADQQHVFGMNIGDHFAIFHNHPAREKESKAQSPNYWTGYGHFPHSVQDERVNLSIYKIPRRKGIMEADLLDYTRAFFPTRLFDTAWISENYIFGKLGDTYCAMIGSGDFAYRDTAMDDIILQGKKSYWITEAGSKAEDGSFEAFTTRIRNNKVEFHRRKLELQYQSGEKLYALKFDNDFKIDDAVVNTNYRRYDAPYVQGDRKDETISFSHGGEFLHLDFHNLIRKH
ncbi:MAG: hypothetical protein WD578_08690 [Bacteroidales bacterium]